MRQRHSFVGNNKIKTNQRCILKILNKVFKYQNEMSCTIKSVELLKDGYASPILATFQSGEFTNVDHLQCERVADKETKEKFALIASDSTVYKSSITDQSLVNTFIAVRNKSTNKVRLVQVHESSFKSHHYDTTETAYRNTNLNAMDLQLRQFGGKAAIRYLEKSSKTKSNLEVMADDIKKSMAAAEVVFNADSFDEHQKSREENVKSIFPKVNSEATKVKDVYLLENIISRDILSHLEIVAVELLKTDIKEVPLLSSYLLDIVAHAQMSKEPDSPLNIKNISICIYADCLIRLMQNKPMNAAKQELSKISTKVEEDIKEKFFQQDLTKKVNSTYTRQKSIIYYIVLLLMTNEKLQLNIDHISDGTKLPKTEIMKYAKLIGGKLKDKSTLYLTLISDAFRESVLVKSGKKKSRR